MVALLGGAKVIVPAAIPVQLSGIGLLGGRTDEREVGLTIPGAPLLRVRAFTVLGGVEIADRSDEERRRAIHLDEDELVIELRGMGAVAAFRRQLRVPYTAIRSVGTGPADIPPWWAPRMGTAVPFTDIRHGRFRHRGAWSFCAVHDADHAVTLELEDVALRGRPLRRAIVGVEDPEEWRRRIEERLAQTGSS